MYMQMDTHKCLHINPGGSERPEAYLWALNLSMIPTLRIPAPEEATFLSRKCYFQPLSKLISSRI